MSDGPRQSCTWRTRRTHCERSPSPWARPPGGARWWATSMTVARPRVGPPPLAVPPDQDVAPSILAFAPGAGRAMGMAAGPGAPNPTPANPIGKSRRAGASLATPLGRGAVLSELLEAGGRRCNWVRAAIGFL